MRETGILISLKNITRFHGPRLIFKNACLDVAPGQAALITGSNGAGKSTFLRLMAGFIKPDSGEIVRRDGLRVGYLGHAAFLYPGLTGRENLRFWLSCAGLRPSGSDIEIVLERAGLADAADDSCRHFSRGMAQRLNFARVLAEKADLLLLDEPFSGMDQDSARKLRNEILCLKKAGTGMAIISHAPEVDSILADSIHIIENNALRLCQ